MTQEAKAEAGVQSRLYFIKNSRTGPSAFAEGDEPFFIRNFQVINSETLTTPYGLLKIG